MTEIDTRTAELLDELLWHARHAQERIELNTLADYWYVLRQRNTYARAAALVIATELGQDPALIADRIVDAITTGTTDPATLRSVALDGHPAPTCGGLEWLGRKGFDARFGDVPGLDQHYGTRWGAGRNQRISRRRLPEANEGMLYAYDPTWDEYALLQRRVPAADVGAVFLQALRRDPNLPVQDFARLLQAHRDIRTRTVPASLTVPVLEP